MEFQIKRYKETFDRAIAFAVDHPGTIWCYGNHDVSYPWGRLETGYSPYAERMVMSKLEELENSLKSPTQINIMHRIDNVLFSHGGLTTVFLKWFKEDLLDADIDDVIAAVNDAAPDYLWNDASPLWNRAQYETKENDIIIKIRSKNAKVLKLGDGMDYPRNTGHFQTKQGETKL